MMAVDVDRLSRPELLLLGAWSQEANHELVVFNHIRTGARILAGQIEALVDFPFITHNENAIPKWNGEDYFVMVRSDFPYLHHRESLRALAIEWVAAGCPDQTKAHLTKCKAYLHTSTMCNWFVRHDQEAMFKEDGNNGVGRGCQYWRRFAG